MTGKISKEQLLALPPEALIGGYLREAKLVEAALDGLGEAGSHVDAAEAYGNAIRERQGAGSLVSLLESEDPFIAYYVGMLLAKTDEHKRVAIDALGRVAELNCGVASVRAERAFNFFKYGDYRGDPVEYERHLREARERREHVDEERRRRKVDGS